MRSSYAWTMKPDNRASDVNVLQQRITTLSYFYPYTPFPIPNSGSWNFPGGGGGVL